MSRTEGGLIHTVQLMQQDAAFRATACQTALQNAQPRDGDTTGAAEYQRVQRAADLLRGYEGRVL